jgi:AraC-like DNA-binding protein
MKVAYHQVTQTAQESFRVMELRGPGYQCTWHFHPEFQIGLVLQGAGHRIVGDNISPLEAGDLALLGPNLPHAWQFEASASGVRRELHAVIVYFREDSLGADFLQRPEAAAIRRLLQRAATGLSVRGRTRRAAAALLTAMAAHEGFQRVLDLLQLLHLLAGSDELVPICSAGFLPKLPDQNGERLRKVCELIQERIAEPLHRDEIAKLAHFSPGAFSRFFKARTGKTFHDFVTELRIGRACRLLSEHEMNVTEVALACGFANVASFNRSFRRAKKVNPTEFRKRMPALN